ncbi:MAG: 6,7-dimethyl-8-ribityllumazine synthase [Planctomycetia bacterium]|nr:6,7-dimethyl-8-ribityllumazine synthase [Planctomycetia bacterium]
MNIFEGKPVPPQNGKIAIIVARFNESITKPLLDGALGKLQECGVPEEQITVAWVPGAFELPTLAQRFALDEDYVAVVCLGCVIKGETSHDRHINRAVSSELARMGVENGIPIIFGVLTCETTEQALVRSGQSEGTHDKVVNPKAGNKGAESAQAALEMIDLLQSLPPLPEETMTISESALAGNSLRYSNGEFDAVEEYGDEDEFEEVDEGSDPGWFLPGGSRGDKKSYDARNRDSGRGNRSFRKEERDAGKPRHNEHRTSGKGSGSGHKSAGHAKSEHASKGRKGKK